MGFFRIQLPVLLGYLALQEGTPRWYLPGCTVVSWHKDMERAQVEKPELSGLRMVVAELGEQRF